ncbi:hypothetical protein Tco_1482936 [Tanacetum coccineum]
MVREKTSDEKTGDDDFDVEDDQTRTYGIHVYDQEQEQPTIKPLSPKVIKESVQANMMNEVKNQLPKLIPDAVFNFIQPRLDRTVLQALKSNQISLLTTPTTSSATFTEYELKYKLYNMMFHIHSYDTHKRHLQLYNTLMNSMTIDKMKASDELSLGTNYKKCSHDDQDPPKNYEGEDKKRRRKNTGGSSPKKGKARQESSNYETFDDADEPQQEQEAPTKEIGGRYAHWFKQHNKKDSIDDEKRKEFLRKEKLTKADLRGARFELFKIRFNNNVELEYNMEQCYLAMSDKIDWANREGNTFHNDLCKSLNLTHSIAKYDRDASLSIHYWSESRKWFYKESIGAKSEHEVQGKLHHLDGKLEYDLINSLLLYILSVVIKKRVEDGQLGVESYQRILNLEKPMFLKDNIQYKHPYRTMSDPKGVVYLNKNDRKMVMIYDEVHKFNDGTLNEVCENLKVMISDNVLGYGNASLHGQEWTRKYNEMSQTMIHKIEKNLNEQR